MIKLRVLGVTGLSGAPAEAADALLAQPKRFALLLYLALAAPRGFHRRDRIVGLLWPELDQERARSALRRAVYEIRRLLGEQIIVNRGDEEVGVAPGALWCDAVEVDEAADAGRYARALELYPRQGDLLPGFFVTDAPDFVDWVDRERVALRDKASAAAWSLAAQCALDGDYTNAGKWAKRAAELAPSDERMLRRVMRFLEAHGDIAGALYVYADFRRRLRLEHDADPSRESRELYERLRKQDEDEEQDAGGRHDGPDGLPGPDRGVGARRRPPEPPSRSGGQPPPSGR